MPVTVDKPDISKWQVTENVRSLSTSIIREILKISSQPGVISFAGGLPAPELFPLQDLKEAMASAVDKYDYATVQYSFSTGVPQFRQLIAELSVADGERTAPENILVTSGGQQAIEIVGRAFLDPGDYVICENPTYVGALQAFNYYRPRYAPVEMDDEGMIIDQVEDKIKKYRPKMIYTISTFQNPTGITMSLERREALIELGIRYGIPIVDDDPYSAIRFAGEPQPTLKALGGDAVISLSTFSKRVAPGMRIGWINSPKEMVPTFEKVKQSTDLHTNSLCQFMLYEFVSSGKLAPHLEKIKADYKAKRDRMLVAMREMFPPEVKWTEPEGGMFLWVTLPDHMSAKELFPLAIEQKVAYVPGQPMFPDGSGANTLRLNFSNASHEGIVEGITRLARLIKANM